MPELDSMNSVMRLAKQNISDSVFTSLFKDPEYTIQLYRALHPDDTTATKEDVSIVTLENVLLNQPYNDLGFIVGDRLMVFVEAQSTWSENIVVRSLLYMAQTIQNYLLETKQYIYGSKKVHIPKPELFVLYIGNRKERPSKLTLSDCYFDGQPCDLNVTVNMVYDGKDGDIINQYVTFHKIYLEQYALYGRTEKTVLETIRICKDQDVLREYLMSREKEVVDIMMMLFDKEAIVEGYVREREQAAAEKAAAEATARAKAEARAEAEHQAKETSRTLWRIGLPLEQISSIVHYSVETVMQWLNLSPHDVIANQ